MICVPDEWNWAAESVKAAVTLLEHLQLPHSFYTVKPFLQQIYDVFSNFKPAAETVHSKGLDIATA